MADIAEIDPSFASLTPQAIAPPAIVSAPDDGELVLPVPADAPPIPDAHFGLGRPTQRVNPLARTQTGAELCVC
jgi:hypothetical protein